MTNGGKNKGIDLHGPRAMKISTFPSSIHTASPAETGRPDTRRVKQANDHTHTVNAAMGLTIGRGLKIPRSGAKQPVPTSPALAGEKWFAEQHPAKQAGSFLPGSSGHKHPPPNIPGCNS